MDIFLVILISYVSGSIPYGLILTKLFGKKDIRKIGSGNIGATNVLRTGNKFLAATTLILDILKGYVPVLFTNNYFPDLIHLSGLFAFLGHLFPIWLKFKGGKGVATYIGFLIGANYFLGMFFILSWLIVALVSKYSSLSSIISLIITPLFAIYFFSFTTSIFFYYVTPSAYILFFYNSLSGQLYLFPIVGGTNLPPRK